MTGRLEPILAVARARVEALRPRRAGIERAAAESLAPPPFLVRPADGSVGVIAEVKRRSPSEGSIREDLDPVALAGDYVRGGAIAISVLTEETFFGGSLADLEAVARLFRPRSLPVLRKDFVLDEVQLLEARAAGAAAVLLIVRALSTTRLLELSREARWLGLATLVEVHSVGELEDALAVEASAVGVNCRDLDTFEVDLRTAEDVLPQVPANVPAVAESGINSRTDVVRMADAGADAVLVGTVLARSPKPTVAVSDLTGVTRRERLGEQEST